MRKLWVKKLSAGHPQPTAASRKPSWTCLRVIGAPSPHLAIGRLASAPAPKRSGKVRAIADAAHTTQTWNGHSDLVWALEVPKCSWSVLEDRKMITTSSGVSRGGAAPPAPEIVDVNVPPERGVNLCLMSG